MVYRLHDNDTVRLTELELREKSGKEVAKDEVIISPPQVGRGVGTLATAPHSSSLPSALETCYSQIILRAASVPLSSILFRQGPQPIENQDSVPYRS